MNKKNKSKKTVAKKTAAAKDKALEAERKELFNETPDGLDSLSQRDRTMVERIEKVVADTAGAMRDGDGRAIAESFAELTRVEREFGRFRLLARRYMRRD